MPFFNATVYVKDQSPIHEADDHIYTSDSISIQQPNDLYPNRDPHGPHFSVIAYRYSNSMTASHDHIMMAYCTPNTALP